VFVTASFFQVCLVYVHFDTQLKQQSAKYLDFDECGLFCCYVDMLRGAIREYGKEPSLDPCSKSKALGNCDKFVLSLNEYFWY
jgi:hypothetical protein